MATILDANIGYMMTVRQSLANQPAGLTAITETDDFTLVAALSPTTVPPVSQFILYMAMDLGDTTINLLTAAGIEGTVTLLGLKLVSFILDCAGHPDIVHIDSIIALGYPVAPEQVPAGGAIQVFTRGTAVVVSAGQHNLHIHSTTSGTGKFAALFG